MQSWQKIDTAPKDGTEIWGWLYDTGIVRMRYMSAEESAAEDGGVPDDYLNCWVKSGDPHDDYSPKFWLPLDAIPTPPNVVWVADGNTGRWRDEREAA